ncbi:hypothetical protein OS493_008835 [Desmophyllum pertusum]|uniref:Globin domain-containing protein n=1 Tax=Desmophyllum pertusum TaxID=174260 RepID=A0A9X0CY86_9CNID|nr:hypothetical protein OS493_008835 [Desmophyllum pertusum]
MGCTASVEKHAEKNNNSVSIPLSTKQKYLVRNSWGLVKMNKTLVGKTIFLRLFYMKPDLPKLFPELKNVNSGQIGTSHALFSHAERVMRAVENAVSALDDAVGFTAYLEELGRRHKVRALKPDYLEAMHKAFMWTLDDLLHSTWNSDTAEAWSKLFLFVCDVMIRGLRS